ncbi:hypothetical protein B0T18DRAFT_95383 [Schizothecium vesticola]|uniref:Uncharacterized protein n=1 Tax=Schizothecium vesticola TaxID=314040 RepID=A0AA40F0C8_9PEZI|nr:hypothetical protein B0T18DRAFT_95383 [Schizothecium vesticola]
MERTWKVRPQSAKKGHGTNRPLTLGSIGSSPNSGLRKNVVWTCVIVHRASAHVAKAFGLVFFAGQPNSSHVSAPAQPSPKKTIHDGTIGDALRAASLSLVNTRSLHLFMRTEVMLPTACQGWAARNGDESPTALQAPRIGFHGLMDPPPQPSREANSDHGYTSMPLAMLHDVRRIYKQPQDRTCGDSASWRSTFAAALVAALADEVAISLPIGCPRRRHLVKAQVSPSHHHHWTAPADFEHRLCSQNLQSPLAYRHAGANQAPFKRRPLAGGCSRALHPKMVVVGPKSRRDYHLHYETSTITLAEIPPPPLPPLPNPAVKASRLGHASPHRLTDSDAGLVTDVTKYPMPAIRLQP